MKKILLPAILIGAGLYFMNHFKDLKNKISAKIAKISFNKSESQASGFLKLVFNALIQVSNDSALQATVKGGSLNFIVNGKIVGAVTEVGKVFIEAGKFSLLPVTVKVNTLSILPSLNDIYQLINRNNSIVAEIRGVVNTNLGDIEINEKRTVTI